MATKTAGLAALDELIRVMTPAALDRAGLATHATALRDLAEIVDQATVDAASRPLAAAQSAASCACGGCGWRAMPDEVHSAALPALALGHDAGEGVGGDWTDPLFSTVAIAAAQAHGAIVYAIAAAGLRQGGRPPDPAQASAVPGDRLL